MYIVTTDKKYENHYPYNLIAVIPQITSECLDDDYNVTYYNPEVNINLSNCFRFFDTINDIELKKEFIHHIDFLDNYNSMMQEWQNSEDDSDVYKLQDENIKLLEKYLMVLTKKFGLHYYIDEYYWLYKDKGDKDRFIQNNQDSIFTCFDETNFIDYFEGYFPNEEE